MGVVYGTETGRPSSQADRPAGHGRRLPRQRVRAVRRPLQGGIRRGRGPRLPSFCWTTATRRRPSPCRGSSPSQPPPPTGPGRGGEFSPRLAL